MGEPIKIRDLAEQMIKLSGLKIKNKKNPNGDIEIITTGLRPGEKLFEELLIDNKSKGTIHPLIFIDDEKKSDYKMLPNQLKCLKAFIDKHNKKEALDLLSKLIPEWNRKKT